MNLQKNEWDSLKCSESFTWLKTPTVYSDKCLSYFTESGYKLFMEKTYPIIIKCLNSKDIIISKFSFEESKINIAYKDEHQIVIKQ